MELINNNHISSQQSSKEMYKKRYQKFIYYYSIEKWYDIYYFNENHPPLYY